MADLKNVGAAALQNIRPSAPQSELELDDDVKSSLQEVAGELSPEEAERIAKEKIARLTQVLDRGILNAKLAGILEQVVPEGRKGKFIRNTEEDIVRYSNLGFTFDVKEGARGLHASGNGRVVVGDLVVMTISLEDLNLLKKVKANRVKTKLGLGKAEYKQRARENESSGIVPFDESFTISK